MEGRGTRRPSRLEIGSRQTSSRRLRLRGAFAAFASSSRECAIKWRMTGGVGGGYISLSTLRVIQLRRETAYCTPERGRERELVKILLRIVCRLRAREPLYEREKWENSPGKGEKKQSGSAELLLFAPVFNSKALVKNLL